MKERDHLVKMVNQIAENFSFHGDAEARIADHLQRFWAPSMRRALMDYSAAGGEGLQSAVQGALKRLESA
jgi:formate dehydrogenase subunit delta